MSDIKFSVDDEVIVEGFRLKMTGADFLIDHASRRRNTTPLRRAIVHDFEDGITINWAEDYPGGITLNGVVKISTVSGSHFYVKHHDLHLDHASRRSSATGSRRALVHDFSDGLTLNWNRDYPGGVTINGAVKCPNSLTVAGTNVMTLLTTLENRVRDLEARIAVLEAAS